MFELTEQEFQGHREFGGGQQFIPQLSQQLLERHILREPFAQTAKEMGLLNIFRLVQQWHSPGAFRLAVPDRIRAFAAARARAARGDPAGDL